MSPLTSSSRTRLWRAALIGLVAAGVLAFGAHYAPAFRSLGSNRPVWTGQPRIQVSLGFEPLPGSRLLRSHPVTRNGERTQFAQYHSVRSAREVCVQFEERYGTVGGRQPAGKGSMVCVAAGGYAMVGAVDEGRRTLGLVAFDDPKSGGSFYFVGAASPRAEARPEGDAPGQEVPGIPRPFRSRRTLCLDGLGGIESRLLVYEGWGDTADTVELFADQMPRSGWTRNADAERILQQHLPGTVLSFLKGTQRAMVYIERDTATSKVLTAVTYAVKGWLPPDRGL